MKVFFRRIHLYLGLTAGIVISVTCFTGATLVFEKELQSSIYPERYYVKKTGTQLPLDTLVSNLRANVPDAKISSVKVYDDADRSVEITFSQEKAKRKDTAEKKPTPAGNSNNVAFMNPYTGDVIALYSHRTTFFYTMFSLHRWLLAGDVGKLIVGISTSIFLFILITGFILWWPRKMKKLKQRLKVKVAGGWKRLNHDLHISIGFYSAIFLFVFAFTGLAWSFEWFNNGIYKVTGSENKRPEPPLSTFAHDASTVKLNEIYRQIKVSAADGQYYSISLPKDSAAAYAVTVLGTNPVHEKASDQYFFDQYSGRLLTTNLYADRNLGQRVRSTFYPVHVGSIAGLPGRIIALLACIAGFTFPVTGTILWLNRIRKNKEKKTKKPASSSRKTPQPVVEYRP
jgi:uncharacterized iron-regulated membrane protein